MTNFIQMSSGQLEDELIELNDAAQDLQRAADNEGRSLTEKEQSRLDSIFAKFENLEQLLTMQRERERIRPKNMNVSDGVQYGRIEHGSVVAGTTDGDDDQRGLLIAATIRGDHSEVRRLSQAISGSRLDPSRIFAANPNFPGTSAGGEVQIPAPVQIELSGKLMEEGLLPRFRQFRSPTDSLVLAGSKGYDAKTVAGSAAGMTGRIVTDDSPSAWSQYTVDRWVTESVTITLRRIVSYGEWSFALFATSPRSAWQEFLNSTVLAVRHDLEYLAINDATHGVLAGAACISVAKDSGQAADTLSITNIESARSRCYNPSEALWLCNHDTFQQLSGLHKSGTNSDEFVFSPGNGRDVPSSLYGIELMFSDIPPTIGDAGDVLLIQPREVAAAWHSEFPFSVQTSDQHKFDRDVISLRVRSYMGTRPMWTAAFTPRTSTTTRSPYVAIAERA